MVISVRKLFHDVTLVDYKVWVETPIQEILVVEKALVPAKAPVVRRNEDTVFTAVVKPLDDRLRWPPRFVFGSGFYRQVKAFDPVAFGNYNRVHLVIVFHMSKLCIA